MDIKQSLNIIKQLIDLAIKNGVCPNLEATSAISQAWTTIIKEFSKNGNE